MNAKPVRPDEFGRQLGNRAAGPRHGVTSRLLPSKNSLTSRSEVQSSQQDLRVRVLGEPVGHYATDDVVVIGHSAPP